MPRWVRGYVRGVEAVNHRVGRAVMYLIFVMIGILMWSSISKVFFLPSLWTLETAQFTMVAYYILGGAYSIQLGSNVRMDLVYGGWTPKTKAAVDAFSIFFLMFFLVVLLRGAVGSTAYSLGHYQNEPFTYFKDLGVGFITGGPEGAAEHIGRMERSPTAWRPLIWPIKAIMCFGILLMLLQATAEFLRDIARLRGEEI